MAKKLSFPKELFVKWGEAGRNDEPWLESYASADTLAETGESIDVGIYKLVRLAKVRTKTEVEIS